MRWLSMLPRINFLNDNYKIQKINQSKIFVGLTYKSFNCKSSCMCNKPAVLLQNSLSKEEVQQKLNTFYKSYLRQQGIGVTEPTLAMDASLLWPPEAVRGMKTLNKDAFNKTVSVPTVSVKVEYLDNVIKVLKKYLLKLQKFLPIQDCEETTGMKVIYLNPVMVPSNEVKGIIHQLESLYQVEMKMVAVTLGYDNWNAQTVLRAVLPLDQDGSASYSIVGHIIHLNLRDHLHEYKYLIGQVLLEKAKEKITMIVNKADTIDNSDSTFRSFTMEILAGEGSTNVTVKENGSTFTFDFAKVYWNPRLSTEHERIIKKLQHGDVLYDVMAGVGPFAIPAARRKCLVLANDLNPYSYDALKVNCIKNKVGERVHCYNMDGREFIRTVISEDILKRWKESTFTGSIHIAMNLPSIAVEFLPSFIGLLTDKHNVRGCCDTVITLPVVHVYFFSVDDSHQSAVQLVASYLNRHKSQVVNIPNKMQDKECEAQVGSRGNVQNLSACTVANGNSFRDIDGKEEQRGLDDNTPDANNINWKQDFDIDVIEVVAVRRVAPSKVMMRVSFKLSLQQLLGPNFNNVDASVTTSASDTTGVTDEVASNTYNAADYNSAHNSNKKIKLSEQVES